MNKKLLTIFLSLFLAVSCSNKEKTAPDTSTPKTIDPKYSGIWSSSDNPDAVEIDINGNIYEYNNSTRGNKGEVLESTDTSYKVKIYGIEIIITFSNAKSATVNINGENVTYTKTSKGIEHYNGNSYVSTSAVMQSQYFWVSIKDSRVGMSAGSDQASEPSYQGYFSVTGYGTDYSFSTDYYGEPNAIKGTLKFAFDGSSVTVRFTENPGAPADMLNKDIVCNIKNK